MATEEIPGQVITTQPQSGQGGKIRTFEEESDALCDLAKTDKIVVQQMAQYSEACCGYEGENHFDVTDNFGNMIMRASEDSNCCLRQCCDQLHPFTMQIRDRAEKTVITVRRPFRCNNMWCCPCCAQRLEIEWPPGSDIGMVDQNMSIFTPSFDVFDAAGNKTYIIEGPSTLKNRCRNCCCACWPMTWQVCCGCTLKDINFKVLDVSKGSKQAGVIVKKVQAPGGGTFSTEMDRFGIDFPDDADLASKILLTAATFLIDFLYFEGGHDDLDGDPS